MRQPLLLLGGRGRAAAAMRGATLATRTRWSPAHQHLCCPPSRPLLLLTRAVSEQEQQRGEQGQEQQTRQASRPARNLDARPPPGAGPASRSVAPSRMAMPPQQPLQVVRVEDTGQDAWAGIAAVDRGQSENGGSWRKALHLVAGDTSVLLLFAAIGRASHGESWLDLEVVATALPFMLVDEPRTLHLATPCLEAGPWSLVAGCVGWFPAAALLGGFGAQATGGRPVPAALAAAKSWGLGLPLGLAIRSVSRGYIPATPFILVSAGTTFTLLVGWRTLFAAFSKKVR